MEIEGKETHQERTTRRLKRVKKHIKRGQMEAEEGGEKKKDSGGEGG